MLLAPGSIESRLHRSAMEKVDCAAGDLGMLPRQKWVGLMTAPLLEISISDAALMAASGGANSEVELELDRYEAQSIC